MAVYNHEEATARGKRFAARAGLDPASTNREWTAESMPNGKVLVRLETILVLSEDEYNALYTGEPDA